jgi:hypothetical protein
MIVFETELGRLVDELPAFTDVKSNEFDVKYNWGDSSDLFAYLKQAKTTAFPLIWLENGVDTHDLNEQSVTRNAKINIVSIAQVPTEFNPYQYQYDFKEVLQPITDNLISALRQSGISLIDKARIRTTRVTKFSLQEVDKTLSYICNAIVLEAEIKFLNTTNCLNKIHF